MAFSIQSAKTTITQPLLAYNFIVQGIPNVNPLNVKGSAVPGKKVDEINLKLRGRDLYYAGNIGRFEPFQCTMFEDISYTTRTMLELWTQVIADNATGFGFATPVISKDITLYLLAPGTEQIVAAYTLHNAWPVDLGGVTLSFDNATEIISYPVTFRYDYWKRADVSGFSSITDLAGNLGF